MFKVLLVLAAATLVACTLVSAQNPMDMAKTGTGMMQAGATQAGGQTIGMASGKFDHKAAMDQMKAMGMSGPAMATAGASMANPQAFGKALQGGAGNFPGLKKPQIAQLKKEFAGAKSKEAKEKAMAHAAHMMAMANKSG